MKKRKPPQAINSRFSFDWILAILFFLLGGLGLWRVQEINSQSIPPLLPHLPQPSLAISKKEAAPEALIPTLQGPSDQAQFFSGIAERQEVSLRWKTLPYGLTPEIELRRFDDPKFKGVTRPVASGATLFLPDGTYQWRVRVSTARGEKSEWSATRQFTILESAKAL